MSKQALQFFKKSPEKLAALVELINGFPSDIERQRKILPSTLREKVEAEGRVDLLAASIVQAIKELPENLQEYVCSGFWDGGRSDKSASDFAKEGGVIGRYSQLWDAYLSLREIARLPDEEKRPAVWTLNTLYNAPSSVEIDNRSILRPVLPLFMRVITDEEIDVRRIRECPICKRIFWAGRLTMRCCSPRCANTFRVHRHRYRTAEEKADYELRRARREQKKHPSKRRHSKISDTENGE